jgi:hypothetical protein
MRCKICGQQTSADNIITEPKYFVGAGNVCTDCFNKWVSGDYNYLNDKAITKLNELIGGKNV